MIDAIGAISSVTSTAAPLAAKPSEGADFSEIAKSLFDTLRGGEAAAVAGINGEATMQQTIEKVLEAERSLNAAVAIRDKIVSAYLELSRMQI